MKIRFTKMHGVGNDFIVIDQLKNQYNLNASEISLLSHRQFGIGFDQLLIIEASSNPKAEFKYRIFNSDGTEVEQCGNGARCFYHYIKEKNLSTNTQSIHAHLHDVHSKRFGIAICSSGSRSRQRR